MTQSYANAGGSGDRRGYVIPGGDMTWAGGIAPIINGSQGNETWFTNGTPTDIRFDFREPRIMDEATMYQSGATNHGTWKWQGSSDNFSSDINDIGSTFTLGVSAAADVHTTLNGNTTAYRYYRLFRTAGTASGGPFIREFEFKLDDDVGGYATVKSYGDRITSGEVSVSSDVTMSGGVASINCLLDGVSNASNFVASQSSRHITFDFLAPVEITEACWQAADTAGHGTWKWQGSTDNFSSSIVDIGSPFSLQATSDLGQFHTELNGNTTAYRYYRLLQTAGTTGSSNIKEILFQMVVTVGPDSSGVADMELSGIEIDASGDLTPVQAGQGNMEFGGIEIDAAGTDTPPDSLGQGAMEFSGVEISAAGTIPTAAGTGLRQFWTFGI